MDPYLQDDRKIEPLATLIAGVTHCSSHKLDTESLDLLERLNGMKHDAIERLRAQDLQNAVSIARQISEIADHVGIGRLRVLVLSEVMQSALDATSDDDALQDIAVLLERAVLRLIMLTDKDGKSEKMQSDRHALVWGLRCLLEFQITRDAHTAREIDSFGLCHRFLGRLWKESEQSSIKRVKERGRIESALEYLCLSFEGTWTSPYVPELRSIVSRRFETGRFREGLELLRRLNESFTRSSEGTQRHWSERGSERGGFIEDSERQILEAMEPLTQHDPSLALESLSMLGQHHAYSARALIRDHLAAQAAFGRPGVFELRLESLGDALLYDWCTACLAAGDCSSAQRVAERMSPPLRHACNVGIAMKLGDFDALLSTFLDWFKYELPDTAGRVGKKGRDTDGWDRKREQRDCPEHVRTVSIADELGRVFPVLMQHDRWSDIEALLSRRPAGLALSSETAARVHLALLSRAAGAADARGALRQWRSWKSTCTVGPSVQLRREFFIKVCGSAELFEQIAARENGSSPESLTMHQVGRYLLDWLTRGAEVQCGLEMAREELQDRDLLEYLLAEGKRAVMLGDSGRATLLLNPAEDVARKLGDFAALTLTGNLLMRVGDGRGAGIQIEAVQLEENRKNAEALRQQEELDDYYDDVD